jgi:hypothetical protein
MIVADLVALSCMWRFGLICVSAIVPCEDSRVKSQGREDEGVLPLEVRRTETTHAGSTFDTC